MITIDNPFKDGRLNLMEVEPVRTGDDERPPELLPYVDTLGWRQFSDDEVYQFDKRLRAWFKGISSTAEWKRQMPGNRRYSYRETFEAVYGRPYDKAEDSVALQRKTSKVLAYYSSAVYANHKLRDRGVWRHKKSYAFLKEPLKKPPYSLRLRFEEYSEQGVIPTRENMALPTCDAKPRAKDPLSERKQDERSEKMRMANLESRVRKAKRDAAARQDGE